MERRRSFAGVGIGYRWHGDHGLSAVLGFAYLGRLSNNLLNRADAYLEVRWRFLDRYSCQVSHYSTIGDDRGENVFLCGVHFDWDLAGAAGWPGSSWERAAGRPQGWGASRIKHEPA